VSLTSLFFAAAIAWRTFWSVARMKLEGGETVTVNMTRQVPHDPCSLCGGGSIGTVSGEPLCAGCAVGRCVSINTRQVPRVN